MVKKICEHLTYKMKKQMPDIDEERAEAIEYGLELIIGEIPKIILLFAIALILKIGWLVFFAYVSMLPYKISAGGFHLKTNVGCFIGTCIVYIGNACASEYIVWQPGNFKYFFILAIWILSIIMINMYAPADTVNDPILRKKDRKIKKVLSYIFATVTLLVAMVIKNSILSNILLINVLIETLSITRIAYKLTKNEYGYEAYKKQEI